MVEYQGWSELCFRGPSFRRFVRDHAWWLILLGVHTIGWSSIAIVILALAPRSNGTLVSIAVVALVGVLTGVVMFVQILGGAYLGRNDRVVLGADRITEYAFYHRGRAFTYEQVFEVGQRSSRGAYIRYYVYGQRGKLDYNHSCLSYLAKVTDGQRLVQELQSRIAAPRPLSSSSLRPVELGPVDMVDMFPRLIFLGGGFALSIVSWLALSFLRRRALIVVLVVVGAWLASLLGGYYWVWARRRLQGGI